MKEEVFPVINKEPFPPNLTWGKAVIYPLIIAKEPYKDPYKDVIHWFHKEELKVKNG